MGPKLIPLLATRYLYLGELRGHMELMGVGVHLTKHQPDPQADVSWAEGDIGGVGGIGGLHMKNEDSLLQSTLENSRWSIANNRTLSSGLPDLS